MPKKSKDENQIAHSIIQQLTADGKNAAAVALGHLGGLKGGKARAEKLSKKRRREIAKNAADKRWSRNKS